MSSGWINLTSDPNQFDTHRWGIQFACMASKGLNMGGHGCSTPWSGLTTRQAKLGICPLQPYSIYYAIKPQYSSGFPGSLWFSPFWVTCLTQLTCRSVTTSGRTKFTTIKDNLQMKSIPFFDRENFFQVGFCLFDVFAGRQSPPLRQSMNVGIDRECGHPKGLRHDDTGCLVANAR